MDDLTDGVTYAPRTPRSITELRDLAHSILNPAPTTRTVPGDLADLLAARDRLPDVPDLAFSRARARLREAADRGNELAAELLRELEG